MAQNGFIAGEYTSTYDAVDLGETEGGFTLENTMLAEPIVADNMGQTVQDLVYQGQSAFISFVSLEPDKAAILEAFHPFWASAAVTDMLKISDSTNVIGQLGTAVAKALVLTVVANTPAAGTGGIATITLDKAILAPNFPKQLLFATRTRRLPLRFQLLPFDDSGTKRFGTVTANV